MAIDPLAPETVSAGTHGGGAYSIARSTNLTISPTVLPDGFLHVPYSRTITVAGGTRPYTFAVTSGSHPAGLCLSASGDPTGTPAVVGTSSFSVTTTDALGSTATQGYTISVSTAVIPAAERQALIDLYNATGGAGPTVPGWDAAG
ncbi:MAG TPA: hypothetical protein ENK19_04135 [Acidobacteria bacterium]|nr:hypothetical protein [Acidobacteriota bacterium]